MTILAVLIAAAGLSAAMAGAFVLQRWTQRSGFVDAAWSFAVGAAGVALALLPADGAWSGRQLAVACAAAAWSLRLGGHILARSLSGGDDPRYQQLKEEWGADFPRRLFLFLQIQAACALLLACTIGIAARRPGAFPGLADIAGFLLLALAVGGEALADRQLAAFRADPGKSGRVCDTGLWAWSRHPNYFCEWLGWLGYAVVAVDAGGSYPIGFAALAGPAFMYWLLVHVSGVPPLEAHMLRSRGAAFRAYQARVSPFFPRRPSA